MDITCLFKGIHGTLKPVMGSERCIRRIPEITLIRK